MTPYLKIGIIGAGNISDLHAKGYISHNNSKILAVADINKNNSTKMSKKWGAKYQYTDYKDLIKNEEVDVVDIITPHNLHAKMTIEALKAGKHVSVQKPMAISLDECKKMIISASKSNKIFRVFENFVYYPPITKAKKILAEGKIGDPISIRIKSIHGSEKFGWKIPTSSNIWRADEKQSGGGRIIFDYGYHIFTIARYLIGEIDQVFSWIGETKTSNDMILESPSLISWKYKRKNIYGSWDATFSSKFQVNSDYFPEDECIEINGTKGIIWVNRCSGKMSNNPPLEIYSNGHYYSKNFKDFELDWAKSFEIGVHDFISGIQNKKTVLLTGKQAKEIYSFARAAQKSAIENKPISIN